MKRSEPGTRILLLPSSLNVLAIAATLHFVLLQPLDRCVSDWHGGGHENHARQQCQDKEEPLGIHGEDRVVEWKVWK